MTNDVLPFPDGQTGLRTYGMTAWLDYVCYVELVRARERGPPRRRVLALIRVIAEIGCVWINRRAAPCVELRPDS